MYITIVFCFVFLNYYAYCSGAAIEASLKQLAERRTDIFGVGVEETAIGKKIGEEETRKDDKVKSNEPLKCTKSVIIFLLC